MKKISLFLLVCLFSVLFIGCSNEKNNTINTENNKENLNEDDKLPEWVEYLLAQDLTSIVYKKGVLEYNEKAYGYDCTPDKNLSKEQLKEILKKMTSSTLVKDDVRGFGGPCDIGIYIKYVDKNDNTEKEFKIYTSNIIVVKGNDEKTISLIEKEKYIEKEAIDENPNWVFMYDWDTTYVDEVIK